MQALLLAAALLAPSVLAGGCCPMVGDDNMCRCGPCDVPKAVTGNYGGSGHSILPQITHTWTRVSPQQVKASQAAAPAGAVSYISGRIGGAVSSYITPPEGCTSLPVSGYPGASATAAASSSGSGYPTTSSPAAATYTTTSTSVYVTNNSTSTTLIQQTSTKTSSYSASTSPSKTKSGTCTSPTARVEWRKMQGSDQQGLIKAVECLMKTESRSGLAGCQTRWDDLVAVHQSLAVGVHGTGSFLPFHRYFTWIYEQELRNTCAYTGPLPYWDEVLDAGDFGNAPLFTSELYGSVPGPQEECQTDGAFAYVTLNIGTGTSNSPHCLSRQLNETDSSQVNQGYVDGCNSWTGFGDMSMCSYLGPHAYCHDAIGGSMSDVATSPNEPVFYLHHAFIDMNFRDWQMANPTERTYTIGGYTTYECRNGGPGCVKTTLNDRLTSLGFYPDVTIAQVMDTQGGLLCYYYE